LKTSPLLQPYAFLDECYGGPFSQTADRKWSTDAAFPRCESFRAVSTDPGA